MNASFSLLRFLFISLCASLFISYAVALSSDELNLSYLAFSGMIGATIGGLLIFAETVFARFKLKAFIAVLTGLFLGYLMGQAAWALFETVFAYLSVFSLASDTILLFRGLLFLFTSYLALSLSLRAFNRWNLAIPLSSLIHASQAKKEILLDSAILADARLLDLAQSGLLDNSLIVPRFVIQDLQALAEHGEETLRHKARRSLETLKKLEEIPSLRLRYEEIDFPDLRDSFAKLLRLAKSLPANIFTADAHRLQLSSQEEVKIINIHSLANALKMISQTGGYINIKIQRYGKEPRQGVGYLEDGAMVVVNGGAEYIGETIKAQVLSIKHTSSGCMIFCNATEEALLSEQDSPRTIAEIEKQQQPFKNIFALEQEIVKN